MSTAHATSAALHLTIWRSVDEIDVAAWDAVRASDDLFMEVRFLGAIERSMAPQAGFWYLLFRDESEQPVALACLSTYTIDGTQFVPRGPLQRAVALLGKVIPPAVYYKLLFCGIPLSAGQNHLRWTDAADRPAVMALLCKTMDHIARAERARVIVMKEFRDEECSTLDLALQHGFRRADSPTMNLVRPKWDSFADYLTSLTSKQRRNIRNSLKKIDGDKIRIVRPTDPIEIARLFTPAVYNLYYQMFEKSETKFEVMPLEFFQQLAVELPEESRYQFIMDGDQVLAFGASIRSEMSYHPLLSGLDYSRNAEYDLYFNIMYDTFADALSSDVEEVHVGPNADDFKQSRLACHSDYRSVYVKGTRPPIRLMLRLMFDRIFPSIVRPSTIVEDVPA